MPSRSPTATPPSEYVLGTGEVESTRLGLQHRIWSAAAHSLWERAGIRPGMTVLDVGCGPGHASIDLAEIVGPGGRIYAVDESPLFLKHLSDRVLGHHRHNVERVLGDVQSLPSLLPGVACDLAYSRWVLCFVPDPGEVVAGVASLLKPGGRFVVQDYFNYESMSLAPRREPFSRVVRAVGRSIRDRGGDPDVMARLPALCRRHGLRVEHIAVHERVARPGSTLWAWPDTFFRAFIPRLVEAGYLSADERAGFDAAWGEASADPDSFMHTPPVFDLIAVKPGA